MTSSTGKEGVVIGQRSRREKPPPRSVAGKALYLLGEGQLRRWILLIVLAILVSGFEVVGAALIVVLTTLIADPSSPIVLPLLGDVQQAAGAADADDLLGAVLLATAAFFAVRACVFVGQTYVHQRIAEAAGVRMASRIFEGYLRAPYSFHLRRNSAELIRNISHTVGVVVGEVLSPAVTLVSQALLVLGLLGVLVAVAPLATVLAIATMGPMVLVLLRVIHPRLERLGRMAQDASGETIQVLQQSFGAIRDIKMHGRERYFMTRFGAARSLFGRAGYMSTTFYQLPRTLIESFLVLFILGLFGVALVRGQDSSETLALVGLFAYVGLRLQPSLQAIVGALSSLRYCLPAVGDLYADVVALEQLRSAERPNQGLDLRLRESITLQGVTFTYEQAHAPALEEVNLRIRRGESVGICGPTGGGKSTLADVVAGLLTPDTGAVLVDGRDIREGLRSWQEQIGLVSQSIALLDASLRENIAFGVPPEAIDALQLSQAVQVAQLDQFVAALPDGLDTVIGEEGVRLSGGQQQRIAIARALYRDPQVLIFDEGTSALDNVTEAEFVAALERFRGQRTVVVIAHRLSTVQRCDRILLVEDGRISAEGTFDALVSSSPRFRALALQS